MTSNSLLGEYLGKLDGSQGRGFVVKNWKTEKFARNALACTINLSKLLNKVINISSPTNLPHFEVQKKLFHEPQVLLRAEYPKETMPKKEYP